MHRLCRTFFLLLVLLLVTVLASRANKMRKLTDEQRLVEELLKDYDPHTRPIYNASQTVVVNVGLTLNQIFDMDERNQVLTTHVWLDQEWKDEKLHWNPGDYNGLKILRIPPHKIWRPDIVLYNSADDHIEGYMPALAMISHDGNVFWPPIVKFRSTCQIDITYFPFDDQECRLKLGSWAYDGFQVDVQKRENPIDMVNFVVNGEWDLLNVKIVRNVRYYSCCPEPYPDVTFILTMRRRTLYYTYNVIVPCVMLSALTLLGFWMHPDGGEKVALGLTVLLSLSVFMLLIAENMPPTSSYVPLIGVYIITIMGMTSVSVCMAVIISHVHHQSVRGRSVPTWLHPVMKRLARFVLMTYKPIHINNNQCPSTTDTSPDITTPLRDSFSSVNLSFNTESECRFTEATAAILKEKEGIRTSSRGKKKLEKAYGDEILAKLNMVIMRQEALFSCPGGINRDWQHIAEIIDRVFFWVYFFALFLITVVILLLVPFCRSRE